MKQNTFHSSTKAIDVLLSQLNTDVAQCIDLVKNKSTIEQQFFNYMEVGIAPLSVMIEKEAFPLRR